MRKNLDTNEYFFPARKLCCESKTIFFSFRLKNNQIMDESIHQLAEVPNKVPEEAVKVDDRSWIVVHVADLPWCKEQILSFTSLLTTRFLKVVFQSLMSTQKGF